MLRASLAMYDMLAPLRQANDDLWRAIRARLSILSDEVPENLDRLTPYDDVWLKPDLMLAQACGFPFLKLLSGKVRLIGTPVYSFPGGRGPDRASVIIVRSDDPRRHLAAFRGSAAAVNDRLSNSGMNLFRAAISAVAKGSPFFADIRLSGGHMASMEMVRTGGADIAAIDSVTWGMVMQNAPALLQGLTTIGETPYGPGLPLITRVDAPDEEVAMLREAISGAIADPALAHAVGVLGLSGLEILPESAYDRLLELEAQARKAGYPDLA